jgi:exopolysaccharide biosynthesis polyprenyl glycosylphosphotransferase
MSMSANPKKYNTWMLWFLTLGDLLWVGGSVMAAYWVRFSSGWIGDFMADANRVEYYFRALPIILLTFWVTFKYLGLYRQRRGIYATDEFRNLFLGGLFALLMLSGAAFFVRGFAFSIKVLLLTGLLCIPALLIWRASFRLLQVRLRRAGHGVMRTVLVGGGHTAGKVLEILKRHPGLGYRVVGVVDEPEKGKRLAKMLQGIPVLGRIAQLEAVVQKHDADLVLIALPASLHGKTQELLLNFDVPGVELRVVSDLFNLVTSPLAVDELFGIPIFTLREAPLDKWHNRFLKRSFDLALLVPGLLLISPVMLAIALGVKLSSPGPVFYRQERVGKDNHPFGMLKFRSMRADAEKKSGPVWAVKDDPRRTAFGTFLRKTSLDELPQLFNVLKGEMSLVGPRPERPFFVDQFAKSIPNYLRRHQVKAGITGWAQINGLRGDTSIEERTRYDLYYVENWSLFMDMVILARTLLELFEHETAY